jgi:hypothetical protein
MGERLVEVDAPPCVDVAVRRSAGGALTVHVANFVGLPRWDNAPIVDYVPPVGPITLRIKASGVKTVLWQPEGVELAWKQAGDRVEVTIPRVEVHGVVEVRR